MLRFFFKTYLSVTGWKAIGAIPPDLKKFVLVVAPHTSSWDVFLGFAFRSILRLGHIKFMAKKELFKPPLGFFFRKLGGIPVNRQNRTNFVDEVVNMYDQAESLAIALSPEGTRQRVDRLRTGFYHIARKADVPIVMLALDFEHREFCFSTPFYTTGNQSSDLEVIINFFKGVKGKHPELGLDHLADYDGA